MIPGVLVYGSFQKSAGPKTDSNMYHDPYYKDSRKGKIGNHHEVMQDLHHQPYQPLRLQARGAPREILLQSGGVGAWCGGRSRVLMTGPRTAVILGLQFW